MRLQSKMWSGVEWMGEWSGVDTPYTVMTTKAPAVLKRKNTTFFKILNGSSNDSQ